MKKKLYTSIAALGMGMLISATAWATPTALTVRVRAHDAKFVGTGVGELQVTVRDFNSHEILATGFITGGTGNTKVLMKEAKGRDTVLSDAKSAGFTTKIDIDTPRKLLVEVDGPISAGINAHHDTKTTWLIPGQDIKGDGLLFEEYGLIVRNYHPVQHEFVKIGDTVTIGSHVTPMCGCPVSPNFLWDANKYSVKAIITHNGQQVAEVPLHYSGNISNFEAKYKFTSGGTYKVTTIASDDKNNQGVDISSFVAVPEKKYNFMSGVK
jgi:hypothetical protein